MGKPSSTVPDAASRVATGTFTAVGVGTPAGNEMNHEFNVSIWGTFVASVALERSFDGGVTFVNCSLDASGTANGMTTPTSIVCREPESGMLYRLNCTSFTSGPVNWRISQ